MKIQSKIENILNYVSNNSAYYQRLFESNNIDISKIKTIEDLHHIPFTTKDDLARFNEKFLCVPKTEIVDYVTTSGTLSNPVSFYLTDKDLDRLATNEEASFKLVGADSSDIFQMMVTLDKQFMAGLAYYLGIRKLKAGAVRQGPGSPANQIETILKFNTTIIIAIPSFIVKLIEYAKSQHIDLNQTSVKTIICIGESIRDENLEFNELGRRITTNWNVNLHSTYASTEMGAAFTECKIGNGGHLNPDLLILEVINESGKIVKDGELGEVVVTTLGVEGMPLIRYRTGDLCHVYYSTCECGSNSPRLGPVIGRKQQMIKYKGTTIFPPSIFEVLTQSNIDLYQVNVYKNDLGLDDVSIKLPSSIDDKKIIKNLKSALKAKLRVTPTIEMIDKKELIGLVFNPEKRKPIKIVFH
jgi:phenylacetate-CoA ligase